MFKKLVENAKQTAYEMSEMERLFSPANQKAREIVVFAERDIYWQYYSDYIEYILANSDKQITYVTSDINDPVLKTAEQRIKPYFIKNTLTAVFERLDSKVVMIATPEINMGVVKRAPPPVHHVYVFRGISSLHQGYRLGALDNYDSLLCIGQYQIEETRKTEEVYGLKAKELPLIGYPLVERIYRTHLTYDEVAKQNRRKLVLVAPTWDPQQKASIMDCCIEELLEPLGQSSYEVWLRPHPEYVKRWPKKIESIRKQLMKYPNITFQMDLGSMKCLHEADVLITDHSTIAMDYVLGTERPVLHIDTPTRVDNPERDKLGIIPVETTCRQRMGASLSLSELKEINRTLNDLCATKDRFKSTVPELRDVFLANWQRSAAVGGEYILSLCNR